jgi:predicted DNA-binding transcriptional regulator YafY
MSMISTIRRAMQGSDEYVIEMQYVDAKGERSRRVVSPIRFLSSRRFLALCLCREEPRQFYLDRCSEIRLLPAAEVMMPMPMG